MNSIKNLHTHILYQNVAWYEPQTATPMTFRAYFGILDNGSEKDYLLLTFQLQVEILSNSFNSTVSYVQLQSVPMV